MEITPTAENLTKMGYTRDCAYRGWYSEESAKSAKVDKGDGRGFVPCYDRLFVPPFGMTDKMLAEGLRIWVDDNFHLAKFKFGG